MVAPSPWQLRASGRDTGDMLSLLLKAEDEATGAPLTPHQICSEILTLAVAGTETTASVPAWVLYELARHPEIDERVRAELDEASAGGGAATSRTHL
ncbi:cytochrome P450 [Streptomyces sp. NPDC005813]|uniref:cytochrome P450 n=1 Tax=Streptomyces sp. NPDC005813 TaxID=3155592 RepID=UPI0033CA3D83